MRAVRLLALPALALALALAPAAARADGDPASDVLLTQRQYLPYKPSVSPAVKAQLEKATAEIAATGKPVRVALIETPTDLGAVPGFFGRPQEYAKFLSKELQLAYHGGLLVVMPAGTGTAKVPAKAAAALRGLQISSGAQSDDLAKAGIFGVQRIARAQGRPIATVLSEHAGPSVHWGRAVLWLIVAAVLAAVVAAVTYRLRRNASPAPA